MKKWEWLGQSLALDFANTRPDTAEGECADFLADTSGVQEWFDAQRERGRTVPMSGGNHEEYRRLRDVVWLSFRAAIEGEPVSSACLDLLNSTASRSPSAPVLTPASHLTRSWESSDAGIQGAIACDAIEILGTDKAARLRQCNAPGCGMFYLEQRANQRWCSPACGNRARVYRHLSGARKPAKFVDRT